MLSIRKIARELLPLVVLAWATFALLGGAIKLGEHADDGQAGTTDKGSVTVAGLGLCALTVAVMLRTGARIARQLPKILVNLVRQPQLLPCEVPQPTAYERPPLSAPSLELLQILRT